MKLFKDFKTKRQLRKEIAELKGVLFSQRPKLYTVEREVQKISSDMVFDNNVPTEYIKEQIAHGMIEFLKPLIEWDIEDDNANPFKKTYSWKYIFSKEKVIGY